MGGVGKLSSLGKISDFSFFVNPSFFSRLMSWFEILDLSHSEISRFSIAMLVSGVVCLVSLARGGINVRDWHSWGRARAQELCNSNGDFWRERESRSAAQRRG
jgi:hypothetical protein